MIIIADITGRTRLYDEMLFSSMSRIEDDISLLMPSRGLIRMIPKKYQSSSNAIKRIVKIVECFINYFILGIRLVYSKTSILHLQWLPFLEIIGVEYYILLLFKLFRPKLNVVLTVHNVFPHDMEENKKEAYIKRFIKIGQFIDAFIVHTEASKSELSSIYNINESRIHICYHGVFKPLVVGETNEKERKDKFRILMFGLHSFYKGTDILVEAVNKLSDKCKNSVDINIVGLVEKGYYDRLIKMDGSNLIRWKNYFLSDSELGKEISQCNLIVLPYRKISQSGVLLMALNCGKIIVCSDLPSFKETLHGPEHDSSYDNDLFFKSDDSDSLCSLLERYVERSVSETMLLKRMEQLAKDYSWDKSAEKTMEVYRKVLS